MDKLNIEALIESQVNNFSNKNGNISNNEISDEDNLNDDTEDSSISDSNKQYEIDSSGYTVEEKIVSAVWVHERDWNNMTWDKISKTFKLRFGKEPPTQNSLRSWERKLFKYGTVFKSPAKNRSNDRLIHLPYIKASLRENPELTLGQRSKLLGIPQSTLLYILKNDLDMVFVPDQSNNPAIQSMTGTWKHKNHI